MKKERKKQTKLVFREESLHFAISVTNYRQWLKSSEWCWILNTELGH